MKFNILKSLVFFSFILFGISSSYAGRYSHRVSQLAEDYRDNLDGNKLYGEVYSDATTKNGRLACARVVQIVLKKAGVPGFSSKLYGVQQIQSKTRSWKTVPYDEIQAGDIVFWRKAGEDEVCSGGGDCHVGIAVGNGQSFDNNGIWGRPEISGIGYRLRWRYMYAKRMR